MGCRTIEIRISRKTFNFSSFRACCRSRTAACRDVGRGGYRNPPLRCVVCGRASCYTRVMERHDRWALPRLASLLVCAGVLAGCGGGGTGTPPGPVPSTATPSPSSSPGTTTIDSIVTQNYPEAFGVELAIYAGGVLKYAHGYGQRDRGLPDIFPTMPNFWRSSNPLLSRPTSACAPRRKFWSASASGSNATSWPMPPN